MGGSTLVSRDAEYDTAIVLGGGIKNRKTNSANLIQFSIETRATFSRFS